VLTNVNCQEGLHRVHIVIACGPGSKYAGQGVCHIAYPYGNEKLSSTAEQLLSLSVNGDPE
jgi:hypothetical protein